MKIFRNYSAWFFLPVFIQIGYRIMQEFLTNNPDRTLLEWTDLAAEVILLKI